MLIPCRFFSILAAVLASLVMTLSAAAGAWATDPVLEDDGSGGFTGRFRQDDPPPSQPAPSSPVEHRPPSDPNPEDSLDGLDPAVRAQVEQCLQESNSDLCFEGLITGVDVGAVAREVVARLQLPDPTPQFGPDPDVNQWHMLAVGYPVWLWTSGPTRLTTTATRYGLSFTLTARWQDTRFELGDGHSLTCSATTGYPVDARPGAASPTCGYTYQEASAATGYTVRAHTNWRVEWAAAGQSGTLDTTYTGSRSVEVGELNALIVR